MSSSTRRSYTAAEKLKIIRYAKTHGNRAAGREFDGVSEANIRLWRSQQDKLKALPRSKKAQRGRAAAFPELEPALIFFVVVFPVYFLQFTVTLPILEKCNPMYNTHPYFSFKILMKKVRIIFEILR